MLSSTAQVTDVAIVRDERLFTSYEGDPVSGALYAKIYGVKGPPGSPITTDIDLGFVSAFDSFAITIAPILPFDWIAAATQILPIYDPRSYLIESDDPQALIPVTGPPPTLDPEVEIWRVSRSGIAVGSVARTIPIIVQGDGTSSAIPYANAAELLGVSSLGNQYCGLAEPSPGADPVAVIFDASLAVEFLDNVPGLVWDIESTFAVGQRNGNATYWRRQGGVWVPYYFEIAGVPQPGELTAIDHFRNGIAGGTVNGEAVVVDMTTGQWLNVDSLLGNPAGTLYRVAGIGYDPYTGQIAFATEGTDLSAWDVTAELPAQLIPVVPGPGFALAPALAIAAVLRFRRTFRVVT